MEPRQPRLYRRQQLRVRVATPAYLVVEVEGVPYYVRCLPNRHNPPTGGPVRPGDVFRVYNMPGPQGPTLAERLTPAGTRDGCTYLLRDYDRAAPASAGAAARGRESRRPTPGARRGARRQEQASCRTLAGARTPPCAPAQHQRSRHAQPQIPSSEPRLSSSS